MSTKSLYVLRPGRSSEFLAQILQAQSFTARIKGLIPFKSLIEKEIFWIPYCQSVHTFFMRFPLDVIFTNRGFKIVRLFERVGPWRVLFGGFRSCHVFEAQAGFIKNKQLKKGDKLHVES